MARVTSTLSATSASRRETAVSEFLTARRRSRLSCGTSRVMPSSVALAVAEAESVRSRAISQRSGPAKRLFSLLAGVGGAGGAPAIGGSAGTSAPSS